MAVALQVDADAYDALLECVGEGDIDKCESVPSGDDAGFLVQPVGGIAVESTGPARYIPILMSVSATFTLVVVRRVFRRVSRNGGMKLQPLRRSWFHRGSKIYMY